MLLSPLHRDKIDAWPVARAGLSERATHALARAHIETVGQLRRMTLPQLLGIGGFGAVCLREVRRFFHYTDQLEAGVISYAHLEEFLRRWLPPRARAVVEHRFLLREHGNGQPEPLATLQSFARRRHLTRERVRQILSRAQRLLNCAPAQWALRQAGGHFAQRINARGGAVEAKTVARWRDPWMGPYSATGTLGFLCRFTDALRYRQGVFTTAENARMDAVKRELLELLRAAPVPLPPAQILSSLSDGDRALAEALLRHLPEIAATRNGEFFLARKHRELLLERVLEQARGPLHFRAVAERFNQMVAPPLRYRPYGIVRLLERCPRCERLSDGYYRLRIT